MRKGEKGIIAAMALSVAVLVGVKIIQASKNDEPDPGIPYYSTASPELTAAAAKLLHENDCKSCHFLWGTRDMTIAVPAPALDGIGNFHDEKWFYNYFSAEVPQDLLPTRLKPQYRMPSYAHLPEADRLTLAKYMASLQVEEWYLEETKKRRYEKLTGNDYEDSNDTQAK